MVPIRTFDSFVKFRITLKCMEEPLAKKTLHCSVLFQTSENNSKECRSTVREEALYQTMLSAVTPTL